MKIKKLLTFIIAVLMSVSAFSLVACGGKDKGDNDNGLKYTENANNTYSVSGYEGESTVVVIPESKDGKAVTKISANAFAEMGITEITIPSSIIEIGNGAFGSCSKLTKVNYGGTVDNWAVITFSNEDANPIRYSKNLTIGGNLVTSITFTTATEVKDYAFMDYTPLTTLNLGESVVNVGISAFDGCSKLYDLTFGSNVEYLAFRAFCNCSSLTSVEFNAGIKMLDNESFRYCTKLESVFIPASLTVINKASFNYDGQLRSAIFEVTEGWFVSANESASFGEEIDPELLADPLEAAALLSVKTYNRDYFWKRAE